MNIGTGVPFVYRKACAEEAGGERGVVGNMNGLAVQRGSFSGSGGEEFVPRGVEDRGAE